jgi:hypothetical protein
MEEMEGRNVVGEEQMDGMDGRGGGEEECKEGMKDRNHEINDGR